MVPTASAHPADCRGISVTSAAIRHARSSTLTRPTSRDVTDCSAQALPLRSRRERAGADWVLTEVRGCV